MAFTWNVEDMALLNERKGGGIIIGKELIFRAESQLSREEKVTFIDSQTEGLMTALLQLREKFEAEKDTLKRDKWGIIKTNSRNAWMRRNTKDTKIRWSEYSGEIYGLFGMERSIDSLNEKRCYDTYADIVDEMFHRLLKDCLKKEQGWFNAHDEYSVLAKKLRESVVMPLVMPMWYGSDGRIGIRGEDGSDREFTLEELRYLNEKCDALEAEIRERTKDIRTGFFSMQEQEGESGT